MNPIERTGTEILDKIMQHSLDMICIINEDGLFVLMSKACKQIVGYEFEEMQGQSIWDFIHPDDKEATAEIMGRLLDGYKTNSFENRYLHKDGYSVPLIWSAVWDEEDNSMFCVARDATERNTMLKKLKEKEELHGALIEQGDDILSLIDEQANFIFTGGATYRALGFLPEQLIGQNAFTLVHPDDVYRTKAALEILLSDGKASIPEFRLKNATGEWRWLETIGTNQLNNPHIKALVLSSRDITERKLRSLIIAKGEQRYKALFEGNPDAIIVEERDGTIIDINCAGEALAGLPKQSIIGSSLANVLPAEAIPICMHHLALAFEGDVVKYQLEINKEHNEKLILDITKVPVELDGEIIAVHSVIKDITATTLYHQTVKEHAKKLNTIFESITDAFFTLNKNWEFTYINSEFDRLLNTQRHYKIGKNIWDIFPEEVGQEFYQHYHKAVETGESVHFEAYFKSADCWFDVKAYPSEEGLSVYFSDISDKVKAQQELKLMSLVASSIDNSVVITDANGLTEWVNTGFTKCTGYTLAEMVRKKPGAVLQGPETDKEAIKLFREKLQQGEYFNAVILNYTKSGEKLWFSMDITPVRDDAGNIRQYIAIQKNINERVKWQQELTKLSLVARHTTNSVIISNKNRAIEWVNEGFTKLTGYSLEEAVGKIPSELLHPNDLDLNPYEEVKHLVLKGEPVSFEIKCTKKSGEIAWFSVQVIPILDEKGEISRYLTTQTDITALKTSEIEFSVLAKDLYKQNRDLQQFTYIVSHNLRAPVANAIGLTRLLSKVDKHSELHDTALANLNTSVQRLDTVLKDLNMILSIRDNASSIDQEEVDLMGVFKQAVATLQQPLKYCGGEIITQIPQGYTIKGNKAYLHSIFYNLLSNAIKYRSDARKLCIKVTCLGSSERGTIISISDNGLGIDLKRAGQDVFKLYKRFHMHKVEGKGLGLYLVKTHTEAMGGRVEISSKVEKGTNFLVYLP
ncbi:PAS domain S-box protein [Pontibacter harenae]|uniref:PAS domain S-box protein n=1 Tax=Pontibacter harenae TaxID=2894083 RepID=UPI001E625F15|nr:PAS domain S-box protein [Pontibacter harenae]MCC9166362.1 PAS domain-containing sensor histidine kinase [Pontibacter harenae]